MYQLGTLLYRQGRIEEAEVRFGEAVTNARLTFSEKSPWIGKYMLARGHALTKLGRYEDAERELLTAHGILLSALGPKQPLTIQASKRLVELFEETGRQADADDWRQRYP